MDAIVTYQQDTVKVNSLVNSIPQNKKLENVMDRQKPASILDISNREQTQEKKQEKTYTPAQIRQWRLQQENKLLIDNSKYIAPRKELGLSTTEIITQQVILPNREINTGNTDWLTVVIFLGILIFASIRYSYAKYMEHLFLSLLNYATSVRMLQERNYPVFHGAFRLEIIFYISLSVFLFQVLNLFKWENTVTNPIYFLLILGVVLLYFFGKKFLYLMLGSTFEAQYETREYLFNMDNFNRSLGLILLPIVILVSFAPAKSPMLIALSGIVIVLIFNLVLLQRGIFILLKKQFPIFYLFLYLCTLEFLPLLLIYKVVVE